MTNPDDPKHDPNDSADDEADTSDAGSDSEERARPSSKKSASGKSRSSRASKRVPAAKPAPSGLSPAAMMVGVVALVVGGAGGWFGHDAQAKNKLRAESVAAPAGSGGPTGPCGAWQQKVCAGTGEQSAACAEAKGATDLLTPSTCEVAIAGMPATLAKVKAGRASCEQLVSKICTDLPPGSATCSMVKERTPSFPSARCDDMLKHYAEVIQELKGMDQQQGMQPGMQPGMPPGAMPPAGRPPHP